MPAKPSSFIGRKRELAELRRLLAHTRALTLLGPGGCGKTRLAVEFARQQEPRFADGCMIVELAPVRDPAMVSNAIAATAGVRIISGDTLAELALSLRNRHLLAVIDNCEHLIEGVAATLSWLLAACPRISVLATSRERMNVDGETTWRVPSLRLPREGDAPEALAAVESVQLFVERARSLRPGFDIDAANAAAIGAICRRVDGVPLAIELAASRISTMSPAQILSRLSDRFQLLTGGARDADERHRTLRAAMDWSYELLTPPEAALLQRLSVFVGAFSANSAEEICALPSLPKAEVLDGLQRLVDKSMVQVEARPDGQLRFRLLETVRDYASEKLGPGDAHKEAHDRHLALYMQRAGSAFEKSKYRGAVEEHAALWQEIADVRAALVWSRRAPAAEVALASALFHLWVLYAPAEGLRRLNDALARAPFEGSVAYARGVWAAAALAGRAAQPEAIALPEEQFRALIDEVDDDFLRAQFFLGRAFTAERRDGDPTSARDHLLRAAPLFEEGGFLPALSLCLSFLGSIEMQLGNPVAARPHIVRALQVARGIEDAYQVSNAYFQLGWLDLECGAPAEAQGSFTAALELVPPGDLLSSAFLVEGLACIQVGVDDRSALTLFGAAARMRIEIETTLSAPWSLRVEPEMLRARATLPPAAAEAAWHMGFTMPHAQLVAGLRHEQRPPADGAARPGGLSRREIEVAQLVAAGMTTKAMAARLFLSERTVESHMEHILTKLDFSSRAQVAAWVTRQKVGE